MKIENDIEKPCNAVAPDFLLSRGEYLYSKIFARYCSLPFIDSAELFKFDENGKLFSVTFHEQLARDTAEEHFETASKRFTETFGAPAVQDNNGIGTQYLEWQDKSSGTALALSYSDLGTTDPTLLISAFEKSRYVEAGTGDWK